MQDNETSKPGIIERMGLLVDGIRQGSLNVWKIGVLMLKGAYLVTERRHLFEKLGEEVFFKIQKGEWQNAELETKIQQLQKMTRKVEVEEARIRGIRYGTRAGRLWRRSTQS